MESRGYVHMSAGSLGIQKGTSDTLELELQSTYEPPDMSVGNRTQVMSVGNRTQVIYKRSMCS